MGKTEGLRARKQRETRDAIHRVAVTLAAERGPDAATVADISERANVSVRTFHNYYPTKEDAIVGLHEGLPTDAELDELRVGESADLLGDILGILQGLFATGDDDLLAQRRALMAANPQLIQRQWARLIGVEHRIAGAVADRMRASADFGHLDDSDDAALALVVTCNSVLRLSVRKAVAQHTYPTDIQPRIDETFRTLREVLRTLP